MKDVAIFAKGQQFLWKNNRNKFFIRLIKFVILNYNNVIQSPNRVFSSPYKRL